MWFMTIILLFPTSSPTNAQDMNYAVVVFGGVIGLSLAYYYFPKYGGVHWFEGPLSNLDDVDKRAPASAQRSIVSGEDITDEDKKEG